MLDSFRTQFLKWNKASNDIYSVINANYGDSNGRKLVVQIIDGNISFINSGANLMLAWRSADSEGLDSFTSVEGTTDTFELFFTTGMLSNVGTLEASLVLVDSIGRIESNPFDINVIKSVVNDDAVQSDNKFTALTEALIQVSQFKDNFAVITTRLNNNDILLNQKANKNAVFSMDNMGQDIKEAMTGGSVAVVGPDTVIGNRNIVNGTVSADNTEFIEGIKNFVNETLVTMGQYWRINTTTNTIYLGTGDTQEILAYDRIFLRKGMTYAIFNARGVFSGLTDTEGTLISQLSTADTLDNFQVSPQSDRYLYLTRRTTDPQTLVFNRTLLEINQSGIDLKNTPFGYVSVRIKNLEMNGEGIEDGTVSAEKLNFINVIRQYLDESTVSNDTYWGFSSTGKIKTESSSGWFAYPMLKLKKGVTYSILSAKGMFSGIGDSSMNIVHRFAETNLLGDYEWTAGNDDYLFVSRQGTLPKVLNTPKSKVTSSMYSAAFGIFETEIDGLTTGVTKTISVSNGSELVIAVNAITDASADNRYRIELASGIYDMYAALGGSDYVNDVTDNPSNYGERAGFNLPDYVDLVGIGDVTVTYHCPDLVATDESAKRISTINAFRNTSVSNISFSGRNVRYVSHPEAGNSTHNQKQVWENCEFTHLGNRSGLWQNTTAVAGGTGSGGVYRYRNCQFIGAKAPNSAAFSYHDNANQKKNIFELENCDFTTYGNDAIRLGTYGQGEEIHELNITNCRINGRIYLKEENAGSGHGNRWKVRGGGNSKVPHKYQNSAGNPLIIEFSDEISKFKNGMSSTLCVAGTPVRMMNATSFGTIGSGQAFLYSGILMNDTVPGETGIVKTSGYVAVEDTNLTSVNQFQRIYLVNGELSTTVSDKLVGIAMDTEQILLVS